MLSLSGLSSQSAGQNGGLGPGSCSPSVMLPFTGATLQLWAQIIITENAITGNIHGGFALLQALR